MINKLKSESKVLCAQRFLNHGLGIGKLLLTDFVNIDIDLINNLQGYCQRGEFPLSTVIEEDLE